MTRLSVGLSSLLLLLGCWSITSLHPNERHRYPHELFEVMRGEGETNEDRDYFERLVDHTIERARRNRRNLNEKGGGRELEGLPNEDCNGCIEIETRMVVFTAPNGLDDLNAQLEEPVTGLSLPTQATVDEQFRVLQQGYAGTPFTFRLIETQFVENLDYFLRLAEEDALFEAAGMENRRGGRETLNIFFGNVLNGTNIALFPPVPVQGEPASTTDYVLIDIFQMPGLNPAATCCNGGHALIHMVGHWLGLYNTFESHGFFDQDACNNENPNDFIADTPQHQLRFTADGFLDMTCPPILPDTCPDLEGTDPVNNPMNFVNKECIRSFTAGQGRRMNAVYQLFRQSTPTCPAGQSLLSIQLSSDGFLGEIGWFVGTLDGSFEIDDAFTDLGALYAYQFVEQGNVVVHDFCVLSNQDYFFQIEDFNQNGLSPSGFYSVFLNGVQLYSNGEFTIGEVFEFRGDRTTAILRRDVEQFTAEPTPAPTPAAAPAAIGGFCFSGETSVMVQNQGPTLMKNVKVGDQVLVDNDLYEPIYSFGHIDRDATAELLQFLPQKLELSSNHMVFVRGQDAPIPASMVKVGDSLVMMMGDENAEVQAIRKIRRKGIYTPFTPSGTIVVNSVKSSNYIALTPNLYFTALGITFPFTNQDLEHAFQIVHRIWCHYLQFPDMTLENGFSIFTHLPFQIATWFTEQGNSMPTFFQVFALGLFMGLLSVLAAIDWIMTHFTLFVATTAAILFLGRRRQYSGRALK